MDKITSTPRKRKARHRWLRYSLRTALVVMLALSVPFGYRANKIAKRGRAIAAIREAGGQVFTGQQYAEYFSAPNFFQPPHDPWWSYLLDEAPVQQPVYAALFGDQTTDEFLAQHVAELDSLEMLHLEDVAVTNVGLLCLKPLKSLRGLICVRSSKNLHVVQGMDQGTELNCVDLDLVWIVQFLRVHTGFAFQIDDKGLSREGVDQNALFSFKLVNVPLDQLLDTILDPHGMGWLVGDQCIIITSKVRADEERGPLEELRRALPNIVSFDVD